MAEEVDEFVHIRKCVLLGRVERLGKEELGLVWKMGLEMWELEVLEGR